MQRRGKIRCFSRCNQLIGWLRTSSANKCSGRMLAQTQARASVPRGPAVFAASCGAVKFLEFCAETFSTLHFASDVVAHMGD